ncbi:helix-turn-helix domain-containing protein [Jatrophihabitans sp. DSM 45814]
MAVTYSKGLDGKSRPTRRFDTSERDDRIRECRAAGMSYRAIATEVRCSVGTVYRVMNKT